MGQRKTIKRTARKRVKKAEKNAFLQRVMSGMKNILMPPK